MAELAADASPNPACNHDAVIKSHSSDENGSDSSDLDRFGEHNSLPLACVTADALLSYILTPEQSQRKVLSVSIVVEADCCSAARGTNGRKAPAFLSMYPGLFPHAVCSLRAGRLFKAWSPPTSRAQELRDLLALPLTLPPPPVE